MSGRASSLRTAWATWCTARFCAPRSSAHSSKSRRAWRVCATSPKPAKADGHSKLEQGLEHDFKIIKINVEEKKVGLSLRAVSGEEASRPRSSSYKETAHKAPVSSSTTTLGDLVNWRKDER